jgi:hypothetical protein
MSKLPDEARDVVACVARHADVRVLLLPSHTGVPVALVRADTDRSIALGTAAAGDFGEAVTKAATEAFIQVIQPAVHEIEPEAVWTPDDHAALYSTPEWRKKLDWMSQGSTIDPAETVNISPPVAGPNACWYELPPELPDLHVVRVLDPDLIPLTFGYDADPAGREDVKFLLRASGHAEDQPLDPHAFA